MTNVEKFLLILFPLPFTTLGLNFFTFFGSYVPEVFFIIFLLLYIICFGRLRLLKEILLSNKFLFIVYILIGISSLSLIHDDFNFINFYGRFRSLFFFALALFSVYFYSKKNNINEFESSILIVCSSASFMYIINAFLGAQGDNSKIGISMICFSIAACLAFEKKYYLLGAVVVLFSGLAAYLSFFRQNYIIAFYLILVYFFTMAFVSLKLNQQTINISKKTFVPFSLLVLTLLLVYSFLNVFVDFLNSNESRYIQSIGKMNDFIELIKGNSVDESSSLRIESYKYLFENFIYYILPNGLVNDSSLNIKSIWGGQRSVLEMSISRDSLFGYFILNFGFIITFSLVTLFFYKIYLSFRGNFKKELWRFVLIFPLIVLVFFLDGASLTQLQKSLFLGLGVGLIIFNQKTKENNFF